MNVPSEGSLSRIERDPDFWTRSRARFGSPWSWRHLSASSGRHAASVPLVDPALHPWASAQSTLSTKTSHE